MTTTGAITIGMPFWLWKGIDAGMDNRAQQAMWEYWDSGGEVGDPMHPDIGPAARFATGIREEGWRQFPNDSRPADQHVEVALTRAQWEFIVADARDSLPVYQQLARDADGQSGPDMLASVRLCRETIAVVGAALTDDGQDGPPPTSGSATG